MNEEFLARMKDYLKDEYDDFLQGLDKPLYRGLRVNTKKADEEMLKKEVSFLNRPSGFAPHSYLVNFQLGLHPYHIAGAFYMQEPSASSVVTLMDLKPDSTVLDLCAAPGSKSTQILQLLDEGFLISNEIDARRAQALLSNMERMGAVNFAVTSMDTKTLCSQFEACFDRILVDAPCSGEGMMKKHEEARDWSLSKIQACALLQKEILDNAYMALAKDGILLYSTCTYAKEENEEQIAAFLKKYPDLELMEIQADFGRPGLETPGMDASKVRRIFSMDGGEGHFMAKIKKTSGTRRDLPASKNARPESAVLQFLKEQTGTGFEYYSCSRSKTGQAWFGMNHYFVEFKKGKVLRQGVYIGDVIKNRFEPTHAFYLNSFLLPAFKKRVEVSPEQMDVFMHGNILNIPSEKGFTALTYHNIPFGFGKSDGKTIKNRIPKGLRLLEGSHVLISDQPE